MSQWNFFTTFMEMSPKHLQNIIVLTGKTEASENPAKIFAEIVKGGFKIIQTLSFTHVRQSNVRGRVVAPNQDQDQR